MEKSRSSALPKNLELKKLFPAPKIKDWEQLVEKELKGKSKEILFSFLAEGIKLKPLYFEEDVEPEIKESYPGFIPFLRGSTASGNVANGWLTTQKIYGSSAEEINRKLESLIENGMNSGTIDTGKNTAIENYDDLKEALAGINLTSIPVFFNAGETALSLFTSLEKFADKNSIDFQKIKGGVLSNPIGSLAIHGTLENELLLLEKQVKKTLQRKSQLKAIDISSVPYSNGGANAVQEIAIALSEAVEYINTLAEKKIAPEEVVKLSLFTFSTGSSFFKEIAKLRAFRMLWQNVLDEYGIEFNVFIKAVTSEFNFTKFDPYVNMLRVTTEAFSAIAGGADSIEIAPFDFLFGSPSDLGERIARNVHLILKEESHLNQIIDPAGGAFFVENLTNELAEKSWGFFQEIQRQGGIIKALQKGFVQENIEANAQKEVENIEAQKKVLIGINKYANPKEKSSDYAHTNERNSYGKKNPKRKTFEEELNDLLQKFQDNLEETITARPLKQFRLAETFEEVRIRAEEIEQQRNKKVTVALLIHDNPLVLKKKSDFVKSLFEAAGFEVTEFSSTEKTITSRSDAVVILSNEDSKAKSFIEKLSGKNDYPVFVYTTEETDFGKNIFSIYPGINAIEVYKIILNKILI